MRLITDTLSLSKDLVKKLKEHDINYVEELWTKKRSELKSIGLSNEQINDVIINLQLIGLDLNKKKY